MNVSGVTKAQGGFITKYYEVNANTTCDAKYYGSFVSIVTATSGIILTLPPAQSGYIQIFNNTTVSHTIAGIGGSIFYGLSYSGAGSILIYPKDVLTLFCGGNWVITDHTNFNSGLYENSSGYVGIGTTNPENLLEVGTTTGDGSKMRLSGNTAVYLTFRRASSSFFIGPNQNNHFVIFNQSDVGLYLASGQTAWTAYSDFRLKKNINSLNSYLNKMKQIRPVWYQWKTQDENDQHMYPGFIAQEIEQFIPEIINESYSEKYGFNVKGLSMTDMIPFIVKAMQEQQQIIESLQSENNELKSQMSDILSRLSALENK
jgi:hypothetical protein